MKQESKQQESQNLGENVKKQILYLRILECALEQYVFHKTLAAQGMNKGQTKEQLFHHISLETWG